MLYSLEVPPSGGDTWVLGMQAAWSTLPDALKAKVRGRASNMTAPTTAAATRAKA